MKKWWKESVVYQVYPRSFADSNGDGVGDINGIREHLSYLKELGVDVIWLSPVYESPNKDNGYDIADYKSIMREFGTMEDFDKMLARAHELGLKIVMDLVVNHTSDKHAWFMESRRGNDNPYRDFYIWKEGKNGKSPNNWGAWFGGPAWTFDEETDMYYLNCFTKYQPDLNWENEKVRQEVYDMMSWWCDKGIDGFRMDVISMISKDTAYPDGPITKGIYGDFGPYVFNGPRVHEYLKEMNEEVLSKYDIMTVGETAGVTIEEAKKYAGEDSSELNMVFQFEHVEYVAPDSGAIGKWTDVKPPMKEIRAILNKWQQELDGTAWNSLYFSNHDQPRSVSKFGNDSEEYREISAKMLATCLHMMKGTPYVYQGEELGMTNSYFSNIEDYRDVETITLYHEYIENNLISQEKMLSYVQAVSRDNARTPMQWDDRKNAGFTTGTPWIKVNPNYVKINAKGQISNPCSVFNYYKKLISLRKEHEIIVHGKFVPLLEDNDDIYAYERQLDGKKLLVACNFTQEEVSCDLFKDLKGDELISNYEEHKDGVLKPYEGRVVFISNS